MKVKLPLPTTILEHKKEQVTRLERKIENHKNLAAQCYEQQQRHIGVQADSMNELAYLKKEIEIDEAAEALKAEERAKIEAKAAAEEAAKPKLPDQTEDGPAEVAPTP